MQRIVDESLGMSSPSKGNEPSANKFYGATEEISPEEVPLLVKAHPSEKLLFADQYSLGLTPSSTVTFRGARVHVYDSYNEQFLLEESKTETDTTVVKVKRFSSTSFGQSFLRVTYTCVALLLTGFIFVFCFNIIFYLVMNLPVESRVAEGEGVDVGLLIGTLLAIPVLLYSMSTAMAMATTFTTDIWRGGPLVRAITGWSIVVKEWVMFVVFLGVPSLTIAITLLSGSNNWWEVSARIWIDLIFAAFCLFAIGVAWREVETCFRLVESTQDDEQTMEATSSMKRLLKLAHHAFLISQSHRYSGKRDERYTVSGDEEASSSTEGIGYSFSQSPQVESVKKHISWYSRLTQLFCCPRLFDQVDPPERMFTTDEVRDVEIFFTRNNWSLDKMWCRQGSGKAMIMTARGDSALRPDQAWSSLACSSLGSVLVMLLIIALLVWLNTGARLVVLIALLCLLCCVLPMMMDSLALFRTYRAIRYSVGADEGSDGYIFQVWETFYVARPKPWLCYTTFVLEFVFFFLWPLVALYSNNSVSYTTLFLIVGFFSWLRVYFDASAVLARTGMISLRQADNEPEEAQGLEAKASISEIVGKITRSRSVGRWAWIFGVIIILIYFLFLAALDSDSDVSPKNRPEITLLPDFYYPPKPDLPYPTCELTKGFRFPEPWGSTDLLDFAFFAAISYEPPNVTESLLDTWFGPGQVVDEADFVAQYRETTRTDRIPVWFKLFSFPNMPGFGVVSVRGSETSYDWLVNIQLWASSGFAQVIRALIPFGWIWTPILSDLVTAVNLVQSKGFEHVSYYVTVAQFCRDLLAGYEEDGKRFQSLRLTGASLGGGTAIIAGAQTGVNTVAISGPGAELPRRTFNPPVTIEQLNTRVFNVIPDRDYIVRLGGRSRLFQEIGCTAPSNNIFGCHSMWRSVCELAYQCGTENRPAICMCVKRFGYPTPLTNGTRSFAEACGL